MDISDPFFDCGSFTHPNEDWAVDPATQEGIQATLTVARCEEELRRIAKEARQMLSWALDYQDRIDELYRGIEDGEDNSETL